ncbi:MAG: SMP-30/gluconolactonase/LRE family protein [Planctomycetaceae bacterium]|jgi:gluconolactonase|nr:SMP-30/gluconolactonase/LRE family protein [Planctomycetaceae bacterium]
MMSRVFLVFCFVVFLGVSFFVYADDSIIALGARVEKVADGFGFTEGPAADANGDIYFVDDPNSKIYFWSVADKKLSVFVAQSAHANGMYFDKNGQLVVCEGETGSVVSYDKSAKRTLLAAAFEGKRFNKPNDLWIDTKGGIYFTDPVYGKEYKVTQDGEHVYYITPNREKILKVVTDLTKPNGIIGTPDSKSLYITDQVKGKVWRYSIQPDGKLSDKTLFANIGVDGMTIDNRGNIYITADQIYVFDKTGKEIQKINVPETPANICFGGKDRKTLFITARKSIYSIKMNVQGCQ